MAFRRIMAAVAGGVLVTALVAAPASADTPEKFAGAASGEALGLHVLGQSATFGVSSAKLTSALDPVATAAGQLLQLASSTAAGGESGLTRDPEAGEKCATPALPAELAGVVDLGVACSSSLAQVVDGLGHALGAGSVASLDLSANTVLGQLPIGEVLDTAIAPLLEQVNSQLPIDATTPVLALVQDVLETKTLEVKLGKSTSEVVTEASKVTSTGTAAGAEVKILPTPQNLGQLSGIPLATISVGSSKSSASYDRSTGKAVPTVDPALVTVRLAPITGLTGNVTEIAVKPGQTLTILEDTPLESTIVAADGSTFTLPDGTVGAQADAVSLHLLKGVNGGIKLNLASSDALVLGQPPTASPETNPSTIARVPELPRTGGTPWLPVGGLGLLGLATVARRLVARVR